MVEPRFVMMATAGHIDHGKTALVQALTGKNTDRLKEEQERGISIDIDFAPLLLADNIVIGMVDVPGHERFIRNMVAGAVGVDSALLVIDIREGVMPQTQEHIEILDLLGVHGAVIALTKGDLVDDEWKELAPQLIRSDLQGTPFADAPMVITSVKTQEGLTELRALLHTLAQHVMAKDASGPFRLPVDKVFSIPGFGTVVSGTVWHGSVRVGDMLVQVPGDRFVRVRGLQVHGASVSMAVAGERVALNLVGVEKNDIRRGHTIATKGGLAETRLLDVLVSAVEANKMQQLHHRQWVHVHLGTAEVRGRLLLLEADEVASGASGYAQLLLDAPFAANKGDRFILRGASPMMTLGGGHVVDAHPQRVHRRHRLQILSQLQTRDQLNPLQEMIARIEAGEILSESDLAAQVQHLPATVEDGPAFQIGSIKLLQLPSGWLAVNAVLHALEEFRHQLLAIHQQSRLRGSVVRSMAITQFRKQVKTFSARDVEWLIGEGQKRDLWTAHGAMLASTDWHVQLTTEEEKLLITILDELRQSGLLAPNVTEFCAQFGKNAVLVASLLTYAEDEGWLVAPMIGVFWHSEAYEQALAGVRTLALQQAEFTVAMVRDALSIRRKHAILLLEYLDKRGITKRVGDARILFTAVTNS